MIINYLVISEDIIDSLENILNSEKEDYLIYKSSNEEYLYNSNRYEELIEKFVENYKYILEEKTRFYEDNYENLCESAKLSLVSIIDYVDDDYISDDYFYFNFYSENDIKELKSKYETKGYVNTYNKLNFYTTNIKDLVEKYQRVNLIYYNLTKSGKIS